MRRPLIHIAYLFLLFGIAAFFLSGCASTARYRIRHPEPEHAPPEYAKEIREEVTEDDRLVDPKAILPSIESSAITSDVDRSVVVRAISCLIGTPYSYSGVDNNGIDCSGFTLKIFSTLGKILPHSTAEQYRMSLTVPDGTEQFGDLVFFNTTGETPSHVGIYLGGGYFAHASVSSGVTISSLESKYYRERYVAMRRVGK